MVCDDTNHFIFLWTIMLGSLFDNRLIVTHNSCCALYWYTLTTMQGIELSHPSIDLPWMYQSDLFFGVYFATT